MKLNQSGFLAVLEIRNCAEMFTIISGEAELTIWGLNCYAIARRSKQRVSVNAEDTHEQKR